MGHLVGGSLVGGSIGTTWGTMCGRNPNGTKTDGISLALLTIGEVANVAVAGATLTGGPDIGLGRDKNNGPD